MKETSKTCWNKTINILNNNTCIWQNIICCNISSNIIFLHPLSDPLLAQITFAILFGYSRENWNATLPPHLSLRQNKFTFFGRYIEDTPKNINLLMLWKEWLLECAILFHARVEKFMFDILLYGPKILDTINLYVIQYKLQSQGTQKFCGWTKLTQNE